MCAWLLLISETLLNCMSEGRAGLTYLVAPEQKYVVGPSWLPCFSNCVCVLCMISVYIYLVMHHVSILSTKIIKASWKKGPPNYVMMELLPQSDTAALFWQEGNIIQTSTQQRDGQERKHKWGENITLDIIGVIFLVIHIPDLITVAKNIWTQSKDNPPKQRKAKQTSQRKASASRLHLQSNWKVLNNSLDRYVLQMDSDDISVENCWIWLPQMVQWKRDL